MNAILEPFKALWQRKLWPLAVLLVIALVAVPMVLAQEPTPAPAPSPAQAKRDPGMPATFVAAAEISADGERRRVLGAAKDPFAPAPLSAKAKAARKAAAAKKRKAAAKADETPKEAKTGGAGKADDASGPSAAEPPVSSAPTPAPTVPKFSIKVRFGATDGDPATKTVERLAVLPDEENPVLVYRGVESGGKVAIFELTGTVVAVGDGKCAPHPDDCQILKLRAGETEFLTISDTGDETDAQYQLELLKINRRATPASAESESLAKSAGAKLLRKLDRTPRYVFDPKTGTLRKLRK